MRKVCEFQNTAYKISCICDGENGIVFVGDSMGAIKVHQISVEENGNIEGKKISDSMGSHTTMVTEVVYKGDKLYSMAMDNKVSVWNR